MVREMSEAERDIYSLVRVNEIMHVDITTSG